MKITRRSFTGGLAMIAAAPSAWAVADDRALFWSIESPGQPRAIVFAYEPVGAARTADIARDGERFAEEQDRLIGAMPNVKSGAAGVDRNQLKPLLGRLEPANRDRVHALLTLDGRIQTLLDKVSGVELVAMVIVRARARAIRASAARSRKARGPKTSLSRTCSRHRIFSPPA